MSDNIILYGDIVVQGFEDLEIKKLSIRQEAGEHATMSLYARIKNEDEHGYLEQLNAINTVKLLKKDDPLFVGLLLNIKTEKIHQTMYIHIEGISLTYLLDINIISRSFQDTTMKYTGVFDAVTDKSVYPRASYNDQVFKSQTIKHPIIQYMETDWQFLKRIASHEKALLFPSVRTDYPAFFVGCPKGIGDDNIKVHNFHATRNLDKYKIISAEIKSVQPLDFTSFESEVHSIYELGEKVVINDITTHIGKTTYSYDDSTIVNICRFDQKSGLVTRHIPNLNIAGVSLFGRVIDVARDRVKIHLDIDKEQDVDKAHWYPYATMYASQGETGWYCMPELEDTIRLYHPDGNEGKAMVINAVKPHPDTEVENLPPMHRMANPDVKYLRTAFGKEIKLRPDGIDIIAKDGTVFMTLNDDGKMYMNSNEKISLTAVNDIEIKAKNINFEALDKICLKAKDSTMEMVDYIEVKGEEVRTN